MSRLFLTDTHTHTHGPIDTYVSYRCNCIRGTRKLVICRLHQPERQPNPFGNATKNNKRTREAREIRQKKRERQRERERQKKETVSKMCLKMGQSMRHKQNKHTHTYKDRDKSKWNGIYSKIKEIDFPSCFSRLPAWLPRPLLLQLPKPEQCHLPSSSCLCHKYGKCRENYVLGSHWAGLMLCGMFPRC